MWTFVRHAPRVTKGPLEKEHTEETHTHTLTQTQQKGKRQPHTSLMDDAEVGPHIIFPLASRLILLRLFICLPQSISSRTSLFPPLVSYAVEFYLGEPFCFLRDVLRENFPRAAQPHAELVFFISLSVYLSGLFLLTRCRATSSITQMQKQRIILISICGLIVQQFMTFWIISSLFYGTAITIKHH